MATVVGYPGASAKQKAYLDFFAPLVFFGAFVFIGVPIVTLLFRGAPALLVWAGLAIAVSTGLLAARKGYGEILRGMKGSFRWARGADGEEMTARVLQGLPDDCIVIHDFHPAQSDGSLASWNLDHIVVSPRGVFVIDTKNYRSRTVKPSDRSSFTRKNVAQAQGNSATMKRQLKMWSAGALADVFVVPIVVYVQDGAFVEQTKEGLVHVIPLRWLENEIAERHPRRPVSADETIRITNVLFSQLELHIQEQFRADFAHFGRELRARAKKHTEVPQKSVSIQSHPERPRICPDCGGTLVERAVRKGVRAGQRMLGCSNFRSNNCRYVFNLED